MVVDGTSQVSFCNDEQVRSCVKKKVEYVRSTMDDGRSNIEATAEDGRFFEAAFQHVSFFFMPGTLAIFSNFEIKFKRRRKQLFDQ